MIFNCYIYVVTYSFIWQFISVSEAEADGVPCDSIIVESHLKQTDCVIIWNPEISLLSA